MSWLPRFAEEGGEKLAPPCTHPPLITSLLVTITYQYLARIISNLGLPPKKSWIRACIIDYYVKMN